MKKIIMFAVVTLLTIPSVILAAPIKGSDKIITQVVVLTQEYTRIEVSRGIKVEMEQRDGDQIIIYANDNVMPYVECEIEDGELDITIDDDIKTLTNVTVRVSLPTNQNITKIEASSSAKVEIKPELNVKNFNIEASSAAEITFERANVESFAIDATSAANVKGTIKANNGSIGATSASDVEVVILSERCSAKVSSAADITLEGEVGTLYAEASSAGKIQATKCPALEMANAKASSGASIKVNAKKQLVAKASSGGSIRYSGEGQVIPDASSGGSIKPL